MTLPREIEEKFERVLALLLNHGYQETADTLRDIRDFYIRRAASPSWQPIDTLPRTGRVLTAHRSGLIDLGDVFVVRDVNQDAVNHGEIPGWTHWAPLPSAPLPQK